ncbi:hypothetical protein F4820DRAFT_364284 [Hypoxylon rubiginosum]|uniref:Uncharacterized protein n=1 Tax=Hypoxylon rubiginosum TaxID=110542 RepID=A0ACB9ZDQ3_9PEZI|nr:hypothetical protein F4820DRAFT_364284 [Hypoxylon rubiginosum]
MARTNDTECEGIGGAGDIRVRSDRCFRDYSPSDTLISLSDNGQAFYSYPIPTFSDQSGLSTQPRPLQRYEGTTNARLSIVPSALSHDALTTQQNASPCLGDEISPLARFRRDTQPHEQLALGLSLTNSKQHSALVSPPLPLSSAEAERQNSTCESSGISSLCLSSGPAATPTPPKGSETSSAAELRELLHVIESPGWKDHVALEEQVPYLLRATMLKRRVRSETHPRESKTPKVRKRSRSHKHTNAVRHSPPR